jgi:hypothetical protein
MRRELQLTDREWLLLSAYLDGQLSDKERRQVEDLLQTKPASQKALEDLRRTRQVLQHVPIRKVPHDFTISLEQVRKPWLPSFSRVLTYSSALATLLLVVVLGFDFFHFSGIGMASASAASSQSERALLADQNAKSAAVKTPEIINWNGVTSGQAAYDAYGKGGGGDSGSGGMGGGGGGEVGGVSTVPLQGAAPAAGGEENPPANAVVPTEETFAAAPEAAPEAAQPDESLQPSPSSNATAASEEGSSQNPILGIRPADERGTIETTSGKP